jgi:hypothetical protein
MKDHSMDENIFWNYIGICPYVQLVFVQSGDFDFIALYAN